MSPTTPERYASVAAEVHREYRIAQHIPAERTMTLAELQAKAPPSNTLVTVYACEWLHDEPLLEQADARVD